MLAVSEFLIQLIGEALRRFRLVFRSTQSIKAENLFLRRQLALYGERGVKPRRVDPVTRSRWCFSHESAIGGPPWWSCAPEPMIRWHRAGWRLFWRLKSRPGRPAIPQQLQALIRRMSKENPSWGEERIANELRLKLGIAVAPRIVRKYLPRRPPGRPRGDLRWSTFLRLHACPGNRGL
jgi:putative transposase